MDALQRVYDNIRPISLHFPSGLVPSSLLPHVYVGTRRAAVSPRPFGAGLLARLPESPSIRAVVQAAIGFLVYAEPRSLLARGFVRKDDAAPSRGDGTAWEDISSIALNSSVDLFYSAPWRELLQHVGAAPLLSLLCDVNRAIFVSLDNGCWLQLCGVPMSDDVWAKPPPIPQLAVTAPLSAVHSGGAPRRLHHLDAPQAAPLPASYCLFSTAFSKSGPGLPHSHVLSLLGESAVDEASSMLAARRLMHQIFVAAPHIIFLKAEVTRCRPSGVDASAAAARRRELLAAACGQISVLSTKRGRTLRRSRSASGLDAARGDRAPPLRRAMSEGMPAVPAREAGSVMAGTVERLTGLPASVPRALWPVIPLFQGIVLRSRKICWNALLKRHCPLQQLPSGADTDLSSGAGRKRPRDAATTVAAEAPAPLVLEEGNTDGTSSKGGLPMLKLFTPLPNLVSFIGAVIRALVPPPLIGGARNHRSILRFISSMLRCAGAGERAAPRVADALAAIRTNDFGALRGSGDSATLSRFARTWVLWLITNIALPIIRGHFYGCPADAGVGVSGGARALFFRKPLWASALASAWPALQHRLCLKPCSATSLATRECLGFASVRFVPKSLGLRPVMNLAAVHSAWPRAASSENKHGKRARESLASPLLPGPPKRSINKELEMLHHVLRFERRRTPAVAGGGVFSLDGAHAALRAFARLRAARGTAHRPLSAFTADAHAAYDSLSQDRVLAVTSPMLKTDAAYTIRSLTVVRASGPRAVRSPHSAPIAGAAARAGVRAESLQHLSPSIVRSRRLVEAFSEDAVPRFADLAASMARRMRHAVFCDSIVGWGARGVDARTFEKSRALRQLENHVRGHLVATPDGLAVQTVGLPQGSILSAALCNIAFGGAEATVFLPRAAALAPPDAQGAALMMRLTDDWFVAAEDTGVARAIADALHADAPSWGVTINPSKTVASFPFDARGGAEPAPPQKSLRWAQLRFCAETGEPTASHHSYLGRGGMAAAVPGAARVSSSRPAAALSSALHSSLRPKCHAVLLDGALVSAQTAALNVHDICVVAAAKALVVIRRARGSAAAGPQGLRVDTIVQIILSAIGYFDVLVRMRCPAPRFGEARPAALVSTEEYKGAGDQTEDAAGDTTRCRLVLGPAIVADLNGDSSNIADSSVAVQVLRSAALPLSTGELLWVALSAFARVFSRAGGSLHGVVRALVAVRARLCDNVRGARRLRVRASVIHLGGEACVLARSLVTGERGAKN